jgi:hypothetical protein
MVVTCPAQTVCKGALSSKAKDQDGVFRQRMGVRSSFFSWPLMVKLNRNRKKNFYFFFPPLRQQHEEHGDGSADATADHVAAPLLFH